MKRYKVRVMLDMEYDDIFAEDAEEAFIIASNYAIEGGDWSSEIEEVEDELF